MISATTYYVDPQTAYPLGSTMAFGDIKITTTVDRYEQLPATPENLALLKAPNLDAEAKSR